MLSVLQNALNKKLISNLSHCLCLIKSAQSFNLLACKAIVFSLLHIPGEILGQITKSRDVELCNSRPSIALLYILWMPEWQKNYHRTLKIMELAKLRLSIFHLDLLYCLSSLHFETG